VKRLAKILYESHCSAEVCPPQIPSLKTEFKIRSPLLIKRGIFKTQNKEKFSQAEI
jgi:hypothetical protein